MIIFPSKHVSLYDSILGLSGVLIGLIDKPISVNDLWFKFGTINNTKNCPSYHNHQNFILALDILFSFGAVTIDDNFNLHLCNY
jgi:hypothetical protein